MTTQPMAIDRDDPGAGSTTTTPTTTPPAHGRGGQRGPRHRFAETSAQTAAKFLVMRQRNTWRPPESEEFLGDPSYKRGGQRKHPDRGVVSVELTEETYLRLRSEARRRRIRIGSALELALRSVPWIEDGRFKARAAATETPNVATPRPPNRRGVGPSYRAAELYRRGMSVDEAAAREGVTAASVIRAIRFNGSRVG